MARRLRQYVCSLLLLLLPAQSAGASAPLPLDRPIEYVAIGDSITAGWGTPLIDGARLNGYAPLLHRQMQAHGRATMHNLGIAGLTSGQFLFLLAHWPEAVEQLRRADLITLSIGGNDIIWTEHQKPGDVMAMRAALTKYRSNIQKILSAFRKVNQRARLFVLEVYNPFEQQDPRHRLFNEWITWVNESILAVATQHDATVVPVASLFAAHEKEYVNLANHDIHPNPLGHQMIAKQIAHQLFGRFTPLLVTPEQQPNLLWNGIARNLPTRLIWENSTIYISLPQLKAIDQDARRTLRTRVGANAVRIDGMRIALPSPVLLLDGTLYLPLRPILESIGAKVYWVPDSLTLSVFTK